MKFCAKNLCYNESLGDLWLVRKYINKRQNVCSIIISYFLIYFYFLKSCALKYFKIALWNILRINLLSVIFHQIHTDFFSHRHMSRDAQPLLNSSTGPGIENTPFARFPLQVIGKVFCSQFASVCVYPTIDVFLIQRLSIEPWPNCHCVQANETINDNYDNSWNKLSSQAVWSHIYQSDLLTMFIVYNYKSSTGLSFEIENRNKNTLSPFKEVIFILVLICI